tara:strand:- start:136 stop:909 length:774 start_codon:yes stop_codon:yes gene_type:complete
MDKIVVVHGVLTQFTEKQKKEIFEMHEKGLGSKKISNICNVRTGVIYNFLRRHGKTEPYWETPIIKEDGRVCRRCLKFKLFDDFHKSKIQKDGYRATCKMCRSVDSTKSYISCKIEKPKISIERKKFDKNFGTAMYKALKGKKAGRRWEKLVDYNVNDLITHIEKQFSEDMSWENYGRFWWVDHIIPRTAYKYTNPSDLEFKKCWTIKNLRPCERIQNIKKGNKIYLNLINQYNLFNILPIGLLLTEDLLKINLDKK